MNMDGNLPIAKFAAIHSLLVVCALLCSGCATTVFQSTWRSPDAKPLHLRGRKVAAVFVSRDPLLRRLAEDAMAQEITARGAVGIAAYTFLPDSDVRDPEAAQAKAATLGCAAAAVMRVVGSETQYRHEPPPMFIWGRPPYRRIWGDYWGWGWGTVWAPGYLREERIVKVETLVYSLEDDQLVWAGVSRTFEPLRIESFIAELAVAVSEEMARDGLIADR
jgi:hypothetical protein